MSKNAILLGVGGLAVAGTLALTFALSAMKDKLDEATEILIQYEEKKHCRLLAIEAMIVKEYPDAAKEKGIAAPSDEEVESCVTRFPGLKSDFSPD